ncbi:receptor-interacting serine/threonine-protein kinase 1 isoform X1 [Bufo gargarizans]|uniref:receptor-interacting serine/threonine-protein kinase 1 isoform X1 n=1 Tax=Bufo gargarizans TaxID=30331 RepID=UPI001CF52816|nr:receptor-interacting serine/threonine-protein kinase 1 isoform X1 [Bufo gargarizans]
MESTAAVKDVSLDDIRMSSKDLLDKKEIDSGGFGKVYLCCHRRHGLVALKTVYTGCKNYSYTNDLYEEGKMMHKLNHERIVKLLGIILEDGNYSLVIEYMTKGNLLTVLKQVIVPVSVKARFIMQVIDGMMYLHNQNVIHKDLKPENILADDEFHVKIADLGVAAFQKWSSLTKEETARQRSRSRIASTVGTKNAGTLSYMAPEHLKSLNRKATEKSDVYSFSIVIWVILTNKEPYENAINSQQLSLCVTSGERPDLQESLQCGLKEASDLMQQCWKEEPEERPTFRDCDNTFRPLYCQKYEKYIAKDVAAMKESYPKPDPFVQRMASLQLDCDAEPPSIPRDDPLSLHSSLGSRNGYVHEALFTASNQPVECEEENIFLERKLQEEKIYHQTGSRIDNMTNLSNPTLSELSRRVFSKAKERNSAPIDSHPASMPELYLQHPNLFTRVSKPVDFKEPNEFPDVPETYPLLNIPYRFPRTFPPAYSPDSSVPLDSAKQPIAESGRPNLYPLPSNHTYDAAVSHAVGTEGNTMFPKGNFGYPQMYSPEKSVNLTISNSTAFQIGNNNFLSAGGELDMKMNPVTQGSYYQQKLYAEVLGSNALLNENQMQLLRENLSRKWKEFARAVGFRQPEIEEIDHDYDRDGLKEKVYQMLHKWQMKEGSRNATVGKVATALDSLKDTDLLNQLIMLN